MSKKKMMKVCGNCHYFKDETADGDGWCEARNKKMRCDDTCESHEARSRSFARKCMALPFGFDHTLCKGETCPVRRKCVRYMLHVKKRLTATPGAQFYMVCNPKNRELCYWPYEEIQKQNVQAHPAGQ